MMNNDLFNAKNTKKLLDFFNLIYWVIQQKSEVEKNKDDNHLYERRFQNQLTHTHTF